MKRSAFVYFFKIINLYNLLFCLVVFLFASTEMTLFIFSTIGIIVGYYTYNYFYRNEFFMFYNLGLTKTKLLTWIFVINALISIVLLLIFLNFKT